MDNNTGYVITHENASLISYLSGIPIKTLEANKAWLAVYSMDWMPRWRILPRHAAELQMGFRIVESVVDVPQRRTTEEIALEREVLYRSYQRRLAELNKEYDEVISEKDKVIS